MSPLATAALEEARALAVDWVDCDACRRIAAALLRREEITEHVCPDGRVRYRLRGSIEGRRESYGLFDTIEEALAERKAWADELTGDAALTVRRWGAAWLDDREKNGSRRRSELRGIAKERARLRSYIAALRLLRREQHKKGR